MENKSNTKGDEDKSQISYELSILNQVNEMCIQSLPPDYFERWEQIKEFLVKTRKIS